MLYRNIINEHEYFTHIFWFTCYRMSIIATKIKVIFSTLYWNVFRSSLEDRWSGRFLYLFFLYLLKFIQKNTIIPLISILKRVDKLCSKINVFFSEIQRFTNRYFCFQFPFKNKFFLLFNIRLAVKFPMVGLKTFFIGFIWYTTLHFPDCLLFSPLNLNNFFKQHQFLKPFYSLKDSTYSMRFLKSLLYRVRGVFEDIFCIWNK